MTRSSNAAPDRKEVLTSREVRAFFSWSSKWYDKFHRVLFLGNLPDYRQLAAQQVDSQMSGLCLDVASGTGETALAFTRAHPSSRVVTLDISRDMLMTAQTKRAGERIDYVQASAEAAPFRDETFDITMDSWAFNLLSRDSCWPEILRVTKRGGRLVDIDILHRLWDYWFLNPVVRPFILWAKIQSKEEPLLTPRKDFFVEIGLRDVRQQLIRRPLAVVQVTSGTRP